MGDSDQAWILQQLHSSRTSSTPPFRFAFLPLLSLWDRWCPCGFRSLDWTLPPTLIGEAVQVQNLQAFPAPVYTDGSSSNTCTIYVKVSGLRRLLLGLSSSLIECSIETCEMGSKRVLKFTLNQGLIRFLC